MNEDLHVNIPLMDEKHEEFLTLLSNIRSCEKNEFLPLFKEMIEHTKEHFAFEEELMKKYEFYAKGEHLDEHKNLLGEMEYFYEKAQKLPVFGKSYIDDYAYDKFRRHIINIDSQLAMFFKERGIEL
ncbi:hemerythrin family protein [Sulfurimonas sp. HSL-1716]|uniref:bacteriohemerythrin n=1 Tax=Hydrocurvibacter sulfurireducens TaxID=3131937 RepID=UPI0031F7EC78